MSYLNTGNSYVNVGGKRIAYREVAAGRSALPLVMLVHLAANMDNWDSALIDALAQSRHSRPRGTLSSSAELFEAGGSARIQATW